MNRSPTRQMHAVRCLMPLSNPFPVQTFFDNFLQHRQRDEEAESHAHSAHPTGIDPAVKRGTRDAAAGAPAKKAPGVSGSEHGQGRRGRFGFLPPWGCTRGAGGVRLHGETIPSTKFTVNSQGSRFTVHSFKLVRSFRLRLPT